MKRQYLYAAGAVALGALLAWWWKRSKTPPAVAGLLTVGNQTLTINDNVLNPGFALPLGSGCPQGFIC